MAGNELKVTPSLDMYVKNLSSNCWQFSLNCLSKPSLLIFLQIICYLVEKCSFCSDLRIKKVLNT
jgi:hypothetical protein